MYKCPKCKSDNLRSDATVTADPNTGEVTEDTTHFNKSDFTFCCDCSYEGALAEFTISTPT